jgi:hypothetical protein
MLLSAVSVLVVAQSSSEIPEGLMNNPVFIFKVKFQNTHSPSCTESNKNYFVIPAGSQHNLNADQILFVRLYSFLLSQSNKTVKNVNRAE